MVREGPDRLPEDRFLSTDLLGEGGMARVWRAWHRQRGTWCAVKVLRPRFARERAARRRFIDEARTLVRLQHRNVIQAWEVGDEDPPFLVMEVADAGTLKDWTMRNGPMPAKMAVGVAIQVCKGIGAAHRFGVIHRDVKPQNVLVNRKGVCKVCDFGIARIRREDGSDDVPDATTVSSTTGDAMGTLGYMAPEQRSDPRRADVRTDVYGIGATLYDLIVGEPAPHLFAADKNPGLLDPIPPVLRGVLLRAVAYRPEDRYAEVGELSMALYNLRQELDEDPVHTPQLAVGLPPEPLPPQG
ncbi:MAG: serine/threonine-protein kinase, partial [Myxococcota bacterium]